MFATLAGGYPWPADLPPAVALAAVLLDQAEAGLGFLSDGRVHPASSRPDDMAAAWRTARDAGERLAPEAGAGPAPDVPIKVAVEGPWCAGGRSGAMDAARGLNAALTALADAGCPLVEVHEPASSLPTDDFDRGAFAAAHVALLDGVADRVHASLAVTGGDATGLGAEALFAAPYRSHLFDLVAGPDSWRMIAVAPGERGIVVGVGDASGSRLTRVEDVVWAASYAASTKGRGMERIGVAPSGSLAALSPDRARAVLDLLGEAARMTAGGRDEMLSRLDPRAIDARSAALGQYQPGRRRPGA